MIDPDTAQSWGDAGKKRAIAPPRGPAPTATPLATLTARWAEAKAAEDAAKKVVEELRAQILADPRAKIGYEDGSLKIAGVDDVDFEDPRLARALREQELLGEVQKKGIDPAKVRALAKLNERIAGVLERIAEKKPRFERVARGT